MKKTKVISLLVLLLTICLLFVFALASCGKVPQYKTQFPSPWRYYEKFTYTVQDLKGETPETIGEYTVTLSRIKTPSDISIGSLSATGFIGTKMENTLTMLNGDSMTQTAYIALDNRPVMSSHTSNFNGKTLDYTTFYSSKSAEVKGTENGVEFTNKTNLKKFSTSLYYDNASIYTVLRCFKDSLLASGSSFTIPEYYGSSIKISSVTAAKAQEGTRTIEGLEIDGFEKQQITRIIPIVKNHKDLPQGTPYAVEMFKNNITVKDMDTGNPVEIKRVIYKITESNISYTLKSIEAKDF